MYIEKGNWFRMDFRRDPSTQTKHTMALGVPLDKLQPRGRNQGTALNLSLPTSSSVAGCRGCSHRGWGDSPDRDAQPPWVGTWVVLELM